MTATCTVVGTIYTAGGQPVAGATLRFSPQPPSLTPRSGVAVSPAPVEAVSNSGGVLTVVLQPGRYVVQVLAPSGRAMGASVGAVVPEVAFASLAEVLGLEAEAVGEPVPFFVAEGEFLVAEGPFLVFNI